MALVRVLTLSALLAPVLVSAPVMAQSKPKAKEVPSMTVLVDNKREAALVELAVVTKGGEVITVATNLAAGQQVNGKVPNKAGCVVSVDGMFEDGTTVEVANVNLCKDKRITLVE